MLKHIGKASLYVAFLPILFVSWQAYQVAYARFLPAQDGSPTQAHAIATLTHDPRGTADLELDGNLLTIKITLTGLAPNSTHPAHIHSGTCEQSMEGALLAHLPAITANKEGQATLETTLSNVHLPIESLALNVHNGPTLDTDAQKVAIACGDVRFSGNRAHMILGQTEDPDEAVSGNAELSLSNRTLTATLTLHGLAPGSSHAAHIHSGSCERSGPVVHAFPTVIADGQGNAQVSATFANVDTIPASGWYVHVHYSTDLSNQTGYNPISCGNIQLS